MTWRSLMFGAVVGAYVALSAPQGFAAVGTYAVSTCNDATEAVNNSWSWTTTDSSQPDHFAEHASCPYRTGMGGGTADREGGLSTTDALGLSSGAPPGTSAGWVFTAPSGTTATAITYERYIGHQSDPDNYWSPALRVEGTTVPGETCLDSVEDGETCSVGGPPNEGGGSATVVGLSTHQLSLSITCLAPTGQECVTGATLHEAWAAMYGAIVTIADSTPPTLVTPSGPLWGPGNAAGFHRGTESVTVSAQDVGGGVQNVALTADGRPVESYASPCNFTFAQPCPLSTGPQTLTFSTTDLPDGTHTLSLVATDAAGNQSTVAAEEITVDNTAPLAPLGLAANATSPGGPTFLVTWADPIGGAAPITSASYEVCPAAGAGACEAPTSAPADGPATITVPGPGTWDLAVWLTNAAGNGTAANAAHVIVNVPAAKPGGTTGGSTANASLRVSETLNGRELVVHVSGPASGNVRVGFTGRLGGHFVASGARTIGLKQARLTAVFRLGPRTAAHALIRVSARLDHEVAVTSTLRRRASRHAQRKG